MTSIFLYIFLVNISGVQIMMPELKLINVYVMVDQVFIIILMKINKCSCAGIICSKLINSICGNSK
jgi:hypothetical protein